MLVAREGSYLFENAGSIDQKLVAGSSLPPCFQNVCAHNTGARNCSEDILGTLFIVLYMITNTEVFQKAWGIISVGLELRLAFTFCLVVCV